jgi:hypothetical protein
LFDSRGQEVGTGQHQVDVAPAGALHGLELAGQLRRGCANNIHLGDPVRILLDVFVDRCLRQREIARRVADVDRYRRLRERRRRAGRKQCRNGNCHRALQHGAAKVRFLFI